MRGRVRTWSMAALLACVVVTIYLTSLAHHHGGGSLQPIENAQSKVSKDVDRIQKIQFKDAGGKKEEGRVEWKPPVIPKVANPPPPKPPPVTHRPFDAKVEGEVFRNLNLSSRSRREALPVLVMACNRPDVSQTLDTLLKHRPSREAFPIVVSQDCAHQGTADVINKYCDQIDLFIQQPDQSEIKNVPPKQKKISGYWKIARHYKWALDRIFLFYNFSSAIVLEDDLLVSPDFFSYFGATRPILQADPTLLCVSAWNDNGREPFLADNPELLYRTDFFPGLGWMLLQNLWLELSPIFADTFWDDWLRQPSIMKQRACIRPEVSRTKNFGLKGVSGGGNFFKKYVAPVKLNEKPVAWGKKNLTYLIKETYDREFTAAVSRCPLTSLKAATSLDLIGRSPTCVRVPYLRDTKSMKEMYKQLDLMNSLRNGMPRTAYLGVTAVMLKGVRLYLVPRAPLTGPQYAYDPEIKS